jgi:hypothetical protein
VKYDFAFLTGLDIPLLQIQIYRCEDNTLHRYEANYLCLYYVKADTEAGVGQLVH